jgi:hypothetical protein
MKMNNNINSNDYLNFTWLEDSLFLKLCNIKCSKDIKGKKINVEVIIPDKNGETHVQVSKYFEYTIRFTPILFAGKPTPIYYIDSQDLGPDLIKELKKYSKYQRYYIIKRAVLRILEITSPTICYLSLANKLIVKIKGTDLG